MRQSYRLPQAKVSALITLGLLLAPNIALSQADADAANRAPRVVNITPDSAPGWIPSEDLERQARKTAVDFMMDMDSGKISEAYALLSDTNRKEQPLSEFSGRIRQFNALAGEAIERRIVTVTWTKDPAQAPGPGIYVALDIVSRFTNIDRHCGYLVLYQAPSGGAFEVMRQENNYIDNATAASIAKESSPAEVERAWANVSANCPGYKQSAAGSLAPLPEAPNSTIGYDSVDAALAALHANSSIVFTTQNGWTIAEDLKNMTIWSFPPPGHPAYPSAVRRQVVERNGSSIIDTAVHCEATKIACDALVRSFNQLNDNIAGGMSGQQ